MSDLPRNWCTVKIADVLELNENGRPFQQGWSPQCEKYPSENGSWGVLKTTAIQEGEFLPEDNKSLPEELDPRPQLEIKAGDILMTCAGPRNRCGVACFVRSTRPKLMMSGKMYRFRPDLRVLIPQYLETYLHFRDAKYAIDQMKTGINDSGLNLTHGRFSELTLPLPTLKHQHLIMDKIEELFSELDKGIENLKIAREQLNVYRQAVLKQAFEGKLTTQWRKDNKDKLKTTAQLLARIKKERADRYQQRIEEWEHDTKKWNHGGKKGKRPSKPRKQPELKTEENEFSELSSLPDSWDWVLLNDLTEHIVDGTHKTPKYTSSGTYFISAKDIKDFRIDFSNTRFIDKEQHTDLAKRCLPKVGNVLITKSGTIGRVAVVDTEIEFSLFESVANIPTLPPIIPRFLALACFHIIDTYFGVRKQKGVAVRHLHLEDIRRLPIPLPSSSEQFEIAKNLEHIFSMIDHQEIMIDSEITRADVLRQSILKKAFSGKLVEQDSNDEPVSVLLERIKTEKAKQGKPGKKKKRKTAA